MSLGLRREFLRQKLEATKDDVPSISKFGLCNNVFRDTTNCHRDNVEVLQKSDASKARVRFSVLRDTTNCHPDSIKIYQKSEAVNKREAGTKDVPSALKSCLRNNVLQDATNCHRDSIKNVIQNSEAVNKRKAELEQLRRRSLAKDNAARLRNAEAPFDPNNFTERQRKSNELEKAKLQEARSYLNKYRADGNEQLNTFTESRRKTLICERAKLQEAKRYMNNYRAESNGLLQTSSHRRRYSTGSKLSRVPLIDKTNDITSMTPKRLFIANNDGKNNCEEWIAGDRSLGHQCNDRNSIEMSNKRAFLYILKKTNGVGKTKNGDSRRVHSDISNSLLTKLFDSNEHPLSELIDQRDIPVFPDCKHENDLGVSSGDREFLPGGDNNDMKSAYDPYNNDDEDNDTRTDCFTCSVM